MKKILFILLAAVLVCGCKKKDKTEELEWNVSFEYSYMTSRIVSFTVKPEIGATNLKPYEWNFGDGSTENTTYPGVRHTYQRTGDYDVTLRHGSKSYKQTISILDF